MYSARMRVVLVALCAFSVLFCAIRVRSKVFAPSSTTLTVTRIFAGPDGLTHTEQIELRVSPYGQGHPDAVQSDPTKAANAYLVRLPPGYFLDWHHAEHRRYVVPLSGLAELDFGNGEKLTVQPSRLYLAEDLTGKGHTFRVVGESEWVALFVDLD